MENQLFLVSQYLSTLQYSMVKCSVNLNAYALDKSVMVYGCVFFTIFMPLPQAGRCAWSVSLVPVYIHPYISVSLGAHIFEPFMLKFIFGMILAQTNFFNFMVELPLGRARVRMYLGARSQNV